MVDICEQCKLFYKILINNSDNIELKEISSNILISSYLKNKFAAKNLTIKSKNNKVWRSASYFCHASNRILKHLEMFCFKKLFISATTVTL